MTNDDLQNIIQKPGDCAIRNPLKTGGELWLSRSVSSSCSTIGTRHVTFITNPVIIKSWMRTRPDYDYHKQSISVVICDTNIL